MMEAMSAFTLKPIGHMKSVFHFKNGTPRQSSLCQNARGILTIEKSVFNNPEHSLDGLQHYSHAWVLFIFHKNNNAHKKAKVKPPRLNGQRVGVFSTRSPYRPNNIGLSLAKIDRIQDASIHFSGIDILDGTPVIDIKPYIPDYDKPTNHEYLCRQSSPLPFNSSTNKTNAPGSSASKLVIQGENIASEESLIYDNQQEVNTLKDVSVALPNPTGESVQSVEEGFYSLSAALDQARETLEHRVCGGNLHCSDIECEEQKVLIDGINLLDSVDAASGSKAESKVSEEKENNTGNDNNDDEDLLDFLVGNVICKAASDVLLTDDHPVNEESSDVSNYDDFAMSVFHNKRSTLEKRNSNQRETTGGMECGKGGDLAVTAPWLSCPPVTKVNVIFSAESLDQLQSFHSDATDPRYRTEMISSPDDAKKAITSILHEEPRSVYRRQKCQNSVYFFAIDVLHVTCWFDGDAVTVLRIRPAADVPQLQGKH